MSQSLVIGLWLGLAVIAANLPWLSERWLLIFARPDRRAKPFWLRLIEWGLLYGLIAGMGFGFEYKTTGTVHAQDWEFYVVTLCLLLIRPITTGITLFTAEGLNGMETRT